MGEPILRRNGSPPPCPAIRPAGRPVVDVPLAVAGTTIPRDVRFDGQSALRHALSTSSATTGCWRSARRWKTIRISQARERRIRRGRLAGRGRHARVGAGLRRNAGLRHRGLRRLRGRACSAGRTGDKILAHLPGGDLELALGRRQPRLHDRPGRRGLSRRVGRSWRLWDDDEDSTIPSSTSWAACSDRRPSARGWERSTTRPRITTAPSIPVFPECRGQKIYLFWHEYILFPLFLRGHCNLSMLLSRHRDAEILSHAAHHLGFDFVPRLDEPRRGGGSAAAAGQEPADAPDDHARRPARPAPPHGPGADVPGLETGAAAGADGLRLRPAVAGGSWDRFAVPRPFSRARASATGEIFIPPDLDREGLEHFRATDRSAAQRLTEEAETWAESGRRRPAVKWRRRRGCTTRCAAARKCWADGLRASLPGYHAGAVASASDRELSFLFLSPYRRIVGVWAEIRMALHLANGSSLSGEAAGSRRSVHLFRNVNPNPCSPDDLFQAEGTELTPRPRGRRLAADPLGLGTDRPDQGPAGEFLSRGLGCGRGLEFLPAPVGTLLLDAQGRPGPDPRRHVAERRRRACGSTCTTAWK